MVDLEKLKFKRHMSVRDLPKTEKGVCRWCEGKCTPPRTRWCGDKCSEEFIIRFSASAAAGRTIARDKGLCTICGCDAESIKKEVRAWSKGVSWQELSAFLRWLGSPDLCRTWLEVDHIIPVIEGGGCCGLDNLRTVCFRCHKEETKVLAGRRAKGRRTQKELEFPA